jgi:hypothetical protein
MFVLSRFACRFCRHLPENFQEAMLPGCFLLCWHKPAEAVVLQGPERQFGLLLCWHTNLRLLASVQYVVNCFSFRCAYCCMCCVHCCRSLERVIEDNVDTNCATTLLCRKMASTHHVNLVIHCY